METPVLSLALILFGPLLVPLHAVTGAVIILLAGVAAVLVDGWEWGLTAAALAVGAGLVLLLARRRRWPVAWLLAAWIGLGFMPQAGTGLSGRLAAPGTAPITLCWSLWPPVALTGDQWDPARRPPLYENWGSRTALPTGSPGLSLAVLAVLAAALYFVPGIRRVNEPEVESRP